MTISQVDETYTLTFPTVTNQPDNVNSENDVLTVQVRFLVANEPVIFSGRSFEITSTVHYPGGSVFQNAMFSVVGPLVKPLLQLAKSFQVTLFDYTFFLISYFQSNIRNEVGGMQSSFPF